MTTVEKRCVCCDLPEYSCGRKAELALVQPRQTPPLNIGFADLLQRSVMGKWFVAEYRGDCDVCGEEYEPGEEIRADGSGGWQGRACCGPDDERW